MRVNLFGAGMVLAMLALVAVPSGLAQDNENAGAQAFAKGQALLKTGAIQDALQAFATAARAPDARDEYKQQFMLVRNVLNMRQALAVQDDPAKWNKIAVRLRNFYYTLRLYEDLYKLASKMHERNPSASSAVLMADALLCLNRNEEAEKALRSVDGSKLNLHAKTLLGLALARQKKMDEARAIVAGIKMPEQVSPRFLLDVARVKVLVGDVDGGLADLTTAFERTNAKGSAPASRRSPRARRTSSRCRPSGSPR